MWPWLARNLVCPLHEGLLHRPTFARLRALEKSQWSAPDELRALQGCKLRALLGHAADRTRFYADRFRAAGIDPRRDDPFEILKDLEPVSKADLRVHRDELVWRDAPGGLFECNTGGSSGEPLIFCFDRRRQAYDSAARIRTHRWFGVDVGEREFYLWGSPIEVSRTDRLKRLRDALFNHRLCSAFSMTPARLDRYLDEIEWFQPACLFGYPSSLELLATHARARGRRLRTPRLRAVFVTGEVCYPHYRETLEDYFQVPVADCYGSREAGFIAHECPEGNLHLTAENVIVEILREGQRVAPGEAGEIVVTHLDAYAQPFIRYRTGDVGRLKAGRCACGRGLPLLDVVQGRDTDFLYLPDGTVKHALSIIYPLRGLDGLAWFRVVQDEHFAVTVEAVRAAENKTLTPAQVASAVRPVVGEELKLEARFLERIPETGSGKYRYVISQARPQTPNRRGLEVACG